MAAPAVAPSAYPAYHDIPSSSASQPRTSRIPSPIQHLFSLFPLVTFPPPPSHESPFPTSPPLQPQLYVLPGHLRTDLQGNTRTTWTSRDVRCLTSQVEFLFRKVQFETMQVEREESWGPRARSLPFVQLPQQAWAGSAAAAHGMASSSSPPRLLDADSIQIWVETAAPLPYEQVEVEMSSFEPYQTQAIKAEAGMWTTMLQKGVMAAVLLAQLSSEAQASFSTKPFFSSQVRSYLTNQHLAREGNLIHSLSSSAVASTSLARWSSFVPSVSLSWIGVDVNGIGNSGDEESEGKGGSASAAWPEELDVDAVVAEGIQGIEAVGKKMMVNQGQADKWFLGARHPTSLDALLFSQMHTLLSLPADSSDTPVEKLRRAVKDEEALTTWTKRVYDDIVKEKEVEWRKKSAGAGEAGLNQSGSRWYGTSCSPARRDCLVRMV